MDGNGPGQTAQSGWSGPALLPAEPVDPFAPRRRCAPQMTERLPCFVARAGLQFVLLLGLFSGPSLAQPYKPLFSLSTAVGPAYAWGRGAAIWAQLIKERTAGRINIRQFPGSSATAGDPSREFATLRDASVDMAVGSAIAWAEQVPVLNAFALPFFIDDSAALDALLRGDTRAAAFKAIEAAGVVPLAWGDNGFRVLSSAKQSLRQPEDFAGLRVRTSGGGVVDEVLRALGAFPAKMNFAAAQAAMLGSTLDGQETTLAAFLSTKAHTLGQKHVLAWRMTAEPLVFAVSRATWESWSPADREIVRDAAIEAAKQETELARSAADEGAASLQMRAAGVLLERLTAEQRAAFVQATRGVTEKWSAVAGAGFVKAAQAAMAPSPKP